MMIVGAILIIAAAAYGGYYLGQKNEKQKATKAVTAAQSSAAANLPAVTPVETLRNFMGNFYFDNNFSSTGFQQSASLTVTLINTVISKQSQQITVGRIFFCTDSNVLPTTVSFNPEPLSQFSTNTTVTATERFKNSPDISPSYGMVLNNGRWQIYQISCPS